ncbi:hypothetical protein TanjilG_01708 [Lupinus angustifolius]|nr:hypothetical protein TanjilG_01708 [Lupinus angustifolius]
MVLHENTGFIGNSRMLETLQKIVGKISQQESSHDQGQNFSKSYYSQTSKLSLRSTSTSVTETKQMHLG